jgi:nucleotide-binding universal stress UspA family protein
VPRSSKHLMGTTPGVKRLLVPLPDVVGDEPLWQAIADVARAAGSVVRLLCVRPLPFGAPSDTTLAARPRDEEKRRLQAESSRCLDVVASRFGDIPVERVTRFGNLETVILDEAAAWQADLVALSAGDRTWLSRAVRSGTAAKVFGKTGIPALLYTPSPNGGPKSEV